MANLDQVVELFFLLFLLKKYTYGLKDCKESFTSLEICSSDEKYNAGVPDFSIGKPSKVGTSMTLFGINEVDEKKKTISVNILIALWWNDTRLTLRSNDPNEKLDWFNLHNAVKDDKNHIFFPTLKLANVKGMSRESKIDPDDNDFYWLRYPNRLEFQQSMLATFYCSFNFQSFPFDEHECNIELGAAQIFVESLVLEPTWIRYEKEKSEFGQIDINVKQDLVQYDIQLSSIEPFVRFEAGFNYSYSGMNIKLQRNTLGLLMGGLYGPTTIFAILSLISFAISIDAVPGRLGLLITLFLITANIYNSAEGPPNRGFSYLEVWIVGIEVPLLVAIFEYGFLLLVHKFGKGESSEDESSLKDYSILIDKWTMVLSATYIVIFVFLYWIILATL